MTVPTAVVPEQEENAAREALLVKEKQLTRARDALAAERRQLPMVRVEKDYRFEGPDDGVPQDPTGSWTRRHDKYTPEQLAGGRTSS